jgi:1-acyl-sn-glycerol-3-phosphate acyltransferase
MDPKEIEALRRSIAALRGEIEQRFSPRSQTRRGALLGLTNGLGHGLRSRIGTLEASELYQGMRRVLAAFGPGGMEDRSVQIDDFGLDPTYLEQARVLLDFLYDRWWRVQVSGAENVSSEGRVIFVANRSGILPYDGLMIAHAAERADPSHRRPRFLVADWIMNLPFSQPLLARIGGVRACPENAERLLRNGDRIVVFPEGQKGALKSFRQRYQLQRFGRGGFVSLALRLDATVVPVAVVGAEEAHPVLFRPALPRRLLGVPVLITPTFPLLGPLGLLPLPSQWRIRFGEPIGWREEERKKADDALFINRTRDRIRNTIQSLLDEEVHRRAGVFRA